MLTMTAYAPSVMVLKNSKIAFFMYIEVFL
jgi:hypothetical protein